MKLLLVSTDIRVPTEGGEWQGGGRKKERKKKNDLLQAARITEWLRLKRVSEGHLVQSPLLKRKENTLFG